ncbi:MAG: radical SAM protein [candidate division Zixibacteria bacterium]|nr:radical SAM protein [candidate division Zixibacteria bacterium]
MSLSKRIKIGTHRAAKQALKISAFPQMIKSGWSMVLTELTGKDHHPERPLALMVEPSSLCNLKCPQCASGIGKVKREKPNLDCDAYKRLIDKYSKHLLYVLLFNQGEPFLNKRFLEMVRYTHDKHVYTITSTNGHFIRDENEADAVVESRLDEIRVSLDGITPEVYTSYRIGASFDRVIDGIKLLVSAKKKRKRFTPIIELQVLLTNETESQLDDIRDFGKELGVDIVSAKTLQLLDTESDTGLLPSDEQYSRYYNSDGKLKLKGGVKNRCRRLYFQMQVNSDGSVVPCCFDKDGIFQFGNIENGGITSAWNADNFGKFREMILKNRSAIKMCTNCTEGIDGLYSKKWYF